MSILVSGQVVTLKYFGKIESIEDETGEYGRQAAVRIKPCNPEAVSYKSFWMKLPEDPNEKPSMRSKWMRFVTSFNKLYKKVIGGTNEMIGSWVCIEETPKTFEQRDGSGTQEYMEPLVCEIFPTEERAVEAWKAHQATIVKKVREEVPYSPPDVPSAPAPAVAALPPTIVEVLKKQYISVSKEDKTVSENKEALWAVVSAWGYTKEQVMAAVS